jgi:hypothetical protein
MYSCRCFGETYCLHLNSQGESNLNICFFAGYLLGLHSDPEDGGSMYLQSISEHLLDYMASQRQHASQSLLREPQLGEHPETVWKLWRTENLSPLPGTKPQLLGHPVQSLVPMPNELPQQYKPSNVYETVNFIRLFCYFFTDKVHYSLLV